MIECPYKKETRNKSFFFCANTMVHIKDNIVTEEICQKCRVKDYEVKQRDIPDFSDPSLLQKIGNVITETVKHIINTDPITEEQELDRLNICRDGCHYFDTEEEYCTHKKCGCKTSMHNGFKIKIKWKSATCPLNKWESFDV